MPKFTTAWDETKPAGSRSKLLGDDDIREFKKQFRERFAEDHVSLENESDDALVGFHKKTTFVEQASDPLPLTNAFIFFSKETSSKAELWSQNEDGVLSQWTVNGQINVAILGISGAAQGDIIVRGASAFGRLAIGAAYSRLRVTSAGTALEYATQIRRTLFWFLQGSVSTGTRKSARIYLPFACTIKKWILDIGTSPTGAAILVDINKNGSTIWSTQGNRAQIAASASSGNGTTFDTTALAQGDYIDVDVDQVGSTVAGADLTIMLEVEPQ